MTNNRDVLGIYIPRRISQLSNEEILAEIEQLRIRREAELTEISNEKKKKTASKQKTKIHDLTKMDNDDIYTVLAAQMGISLDEFKRLVASTK